MISLKGNRWNGHTDFEEAVSRLHETPSHAVIERSVFPPPALVTQTGGRPIVNAARAGTFPGLGRRTRRSFVVPEEARRLWGLHATLDDAAGVYIDDNFCCHHVFNACFGAKWDSGTFTQLCHIFGEEYSKEPRCFTALPNLVLVPAWLAKLTDSDARVCKTLRWVARKFYRFCPGPGCDRDPEGVGCGLCVRPGHELDIEFVRRAMHRWDSRAVSDYRTSVNNSGGGDRWRDSVRSCHGYDHTFLK